MFPKFVFVQFSIKRWRKAFSFKRPCHFPFDFLWANAKFPFKVQSNVDVNHFHLNLLPPFFIEMDLLKCISTCHSNFIQRLAQIVFIQKLSPLDFMPAFCCSDFCWISFKLISHLRINFNQRWTQIIYIQVCLRPDSFKIDFA